MKRNGFTLIELMIVVTIMTILALIAIPSFMHHNNLMALRKDIWSLQWGLMNNKPLDPSWTQAGNVYTKVLTRPAGTIQITAPLLAGGIWSCSFSDPSYPINSECN